LRRTGWRGSVIAVVVVGTVMVGCGGIVSPDLFVVSRTGGSPGAKLTLLVNEEGVVHCNGGVEHHLSDPQIIEARTIQEDLKTHAERHESLSPAPGSVLGYYVRDQDGSVRFSDNSPGQPDVTRKLALFVLSVARRVCGLSQQGA